MIGIRAKVVILIGTLSILSACTFPAWRDQVLREVAEGRFVFDAARVGAGPKPRTPIEVFGRDGRRLGYGWVQGGTVELFNADGSRAGYGTVGR